LRLTLGSATTPTEVAAAADIIVTVVGEMQAALESTLEG